jgi:hypothetical protein
MKTTTLRLMGIVSIVFSALVMGSVARADVVINEIHYNPLDANLEFLELYNTAGVAVDVSGWSIDIAVAITLPPGTTIQANGYLTLALNPASLAAAGCPGTIVGWTPGGNLSNGGETIRLSDASAAVVDLLTYDDAAPWPTAPDGSGPSLELVNPMLDNGAGGSWAASLATNGTCNAVNSVFSAKPTVTSTTPARGALITSLTQVSVRFSWAVTGVTADDMIVDGTPATAVTGSGAGPYAFTVTNSSTSAVQVVLSAGGIQDALGNAFTGDSWKYFFRYGKLVINENNYHPLNDDEALQFLELYNIDTEMVDLSGWGTIGISHTFAAGTTLAPGAYLVMAKDPAYLQSHVTIPGGVQVVQWTSGDLSNGGETVTLTNEYGTVIDTVTYSDSGEWPPIADGGGPSLELIHPELPNEFSAAWRASLVTHGTPGAQNGVYDPDPAPIVYGTTQTPTRPAGGQSVTVTTGAIARGGVAPTMTLYYRQDADPKLTYASTAMFDDGAHGDGAAGDGRFGATLAGLAAGSQLDFYISATAAGRTAEAPSGHAVLNRFGEPSQTYLAAFSDEVLPTDYPVYQVLVTLSNKHHQEALTGELDRREQFDCTFIDGAGNLWYNLSERYRGQSSILKLPSSYRIDFPTDRPLQSPMGFPVTVLQLNSMNPMRQYLGFELFNRAGIPAAKTAWIHLRYTGINYDSCCNGQNGYYGMHLAIEKVDDDFVGSQNGLVVPSRGLNDAGNLYRGQNDGDLRWEGTNPDAYRADVNDRNGYTKESNSGADVWDDLINLCDALNNTPANQYAANVATRIDEDNWARFFAIHNLLGNKEGGIYRDTGDDFFFYFNPLPAGDNMKMIPWDTDSVLLSSHETLWRTNVASVRNVLRHNAFAPIYVKAIEDLMANEFSAANMGAVIDAMPNVFATSGCNDTDPCTRQQFKNWIAAQTATFLAETIDDLTLVGVPASPYTDVNPVVALSGQLQQAGTHSVTVNGQPAAFSVYAGTWSHNLTLTPGMNTVLVQAWDRTGVEKDRAEQTVFYNPAGSQQLLLTMRAPRRMVNTKTLTIEAKITDAIGRPDYTKWDVLGIVSVRRVSDGTPVPVTMTVFDPHVAVTNGTIRLVNGWGSVSFTLDAGAAFGAGDIDVSVSWSGLTDSQVVTVLDNPPYRAVSGTLSGADLTWGPDEVIRVTGNTTINGGDTLMIRPGTLVWVDTTGSLENGTLFTVNGSVQAVGTRDNPIYLFSDRGPAAMALTQTGSASNAESWRGFFHWGSGTSRYEHVFLTGAGNGVVTGHPRPPILSFNNAHSFVANQSVFADDNGMVFSTPGVGIFTITDCLVNRVGIGGEFMSSGHTLTIKNTWWTSNGYGPEANNLDGDHIHIDGGGSTQLIQGCIFNDGGDDAIDHNGSNFTLLDSIISHTDDKAISMTGGHANLRNVLIFGSPQGIRGVASTEYVTINTGAPIATNDVVQKTIVWPDTIGTCSGTVSYTDVGSSASLGCGTGNFSANPLFVNTSTHDFNLQAGSPALTAGPGATRIGWLGFPNGAVCQTTAECNDNNPCTFDNCEADKTCSFAPIAGCRTCTAAPECDDGNPCTVDTCGGTGACSNVAGNDGATCDDGKSCTSTDLCSNGVCAGAELCPIGQHCNIAGVCSSEPVTLTFQQDVNGYTGTQDTDLYQNGPDTVRGALTTWRWDTDDPSGSGLYEYGLLRFDGIFGSGAGQIPLGSTVSSATLALYLENGTVTPAGNVNELLVDWSEAATTWNNFGGDAGAQADEYGTLVGSAPVATGAGTVDVTASLQAWAANPAASLGWIFRPSNTDGVATTSREGATTANRPKLTVTFTAPVTGCTDSVQCQDGLFCNGAEACIGSICVPGTAPSCDDGVTCTVDACNEAIDACDHAPSSALCDDVNVCTDDVCNAVTGCSHANNSVACDDGNACTTNDACAGGTCASADQTNCDDGVACTTDSCVAPTGCVHQNACPGGQTCNQVSGLCESGPVTKSFQQGVGGYLSTFDTFIDSALGSQAGTTPVVVDGSPVEQVLLRFDGIFGTGVDQIPAGSTITSATLTLRVGGTTNDGSPNPVAFHRLLHPWVDTGVWADYGVSPWNATVGIQADDTDALATADASATMSALDTSYPVSVTGSVQAWSIAPSGDYGWVIVMTTGTDGLRVHSTESATVAYRPLLEVTYIPPIASCTINAQCDDGLWCNGTETCSLATSTCVAGAPPNCVDGVTCTVDSCNETANACDHVATNSLCNDGNVCTDDTCNAVTDCGHTNNTASCSDANACTTGDVCSGGNCVAGGATNCDDGVACTTDACDTALGCSHVSNCPGGQSCNLTTGLCEASAAPPLPIVLGDTWRYFKGSTAPPTAWADLAFDDTGWLSGPSGFGYGTDCAAGHGTVLSDMISSYASVYLRRAFRVDDPGRVTALALTVDYDDAFVAYLNGQEVVRRNVVGTPPSNTQLATADHECSSCNSTCNGAELLDLTSYRLVLQPGTNVIAIQAHNLTLGSTDFTILPTLASTETGCTANGDCDDGRLCNGTETCNLGTSTCVAGTPPVCNDGNPCTTDGCNDATGCTVTPSAAGTACGDGLFCNGAETCDGAGACVAGAPPVCNDGNPCTTDGCNDATGCSTAPVAAGASCADALFCNGAETCDGAGTCVAGTPPSCDDGIACTADSCNEATDACDHGLCAMTAAAEGPRYVAVSPPADVGSVALRVTSAGLTCLPKWLDAAGLLADTPVYRTSVEWATVHAHGRQIVPATLYTLAAETISGQVVGSATALTWEWGDATHAEGVNVLDLLCVLNASRGIFTKCGLRATDVGGEVPDGVVTAEDIQAVQDAFSGVPYADTDPCSAQGGR